MAFDLKTIQMDYQRDGFVLLRDFIAPPLLARLQQTTADFIAQAGDGALDDAEGFDIVRDEHGARRLRRITDPERHAAAYSEVMHDEQLLDVVQCLLGGSARFDHGKLNLKPPGVASAKILWHQDWAFYPQTNDDMLAVGVCIEDCGEENGPLLAVPGSHKRQLYDHHLDGEFVGGISAGLTAEDEAQAQPLIAAAGAISIHHVRTLHASAANLTGRDRPLLLLNYVAADAFPIFHSYDWEEFNSRLLRGAPTQTPRMTDVPRRIPLPAPASDDRYSSVSLFTLQEKIG